MDTQRQRYASDLTDTQWDKIQHFFEGMRHRKWPKRELLNGVLYVLENGIKWRNLPHDFPPWKTVYSFFKRAKDKGIWEDMSAYVTEISREKSGRDALPTYGIIDSQSAKTVYSGDARGIDGGKKIKGRKRHIVVDTSGRILGAEVHQANMHDTKSGILALRVAKDFFPTITACCGDAGYRGTFEREAATELGVEVDIVARNQEDGWKILPKRWVVERTFSWFCNYRSLSKDYEVLSSTEVAFIYLTNIHILLKRLDKNI